MKPPDNCFWDVESIDKLIQAFTSPEHLLWLIVIPITILFSTVISTAVDYASRQCE